VVPSSIHVLKKFKKKQKKILKILKNTLVKKKKVAFTLIYSLVVIVET